MLDINEKNICESCFGEIDAGLEICPLCGYDKNKPSLVTGCLPPNTILIGKYLIGKVLGKGGFGITYLAYDISRKMKVAIKEYMPDSLAYRSPGMTLMSTYQGEKEEAFKIGAEKFYDEAKTIARFNGHPNIINVQEFFYENNTAYFVMEYIEGIDLKKYVAQKGGKISEEEILNIILPLMNALIVVHSVGVLHRDISPDNIYIATDGTVKLLDFGAARQVLGEQSKSLSVVLKPGFAPIEQYQTRGKQGAWTDIYSLAATMYYCLTGEIPEASMDRMEEDKLQPLSQLGVEVTPEFEEALSKALSVRSINRFQTINDFKVALNKKTEETIPLLLGGEGASADSVVSQEISETVAISKANKFSFIPLIKKSKIKVISAAVVAILLLGTGTFALYGNKKNDKSPNGGGGNNLKTNSIISTNLNETNNSNSQLNSDSVSMDGSNSIINSSSLSDNISTGLTSSTTVEVVVPNVIGLISYDAMSNIQKAGLKSSAAEQFSDTVVKGKVVSQSVLGGDKRISGSIINLIISKGKEFETVPSIIGKTATNASSDLANIGFVVSIKQQVDDSKTPGTVIAQSVNAGQKVKFGSTIIATVCINSGKVTVPNVVGKTSSKAASDLTTVGLTSTQTQQFSDSVANGIVISQGNAPGTKIPKGSTVSIVVSKGIEQVSVPYVIGKTISQAAAAMASVGLNSTQTQQYNDTVPSGVVISQSNVAGTKISKGTTVNMIVSKGSSAWSSWLNAIPSGITTTGYYIEEKTQYQYRNKETKTNSASSLTGWTKYNETFVWGGWVSNDTNPVGSTTNREVRTVSIDRGWNKPQWKYSHWWKWGGTYYLAWPVQGGCPYYEETPWLDSPIASAGQNHGGYEAYGLATIPGTTATYSYWYSPQTRQLWISNWVTVYEYRDKVFTYYFYRWNDWSTWQDAIVTATSDREVNTKKLYRYRLK